jgi:uncharacterized membrane protein YfcA
MNPSEYIILIMTGIVAGFMNTVASSGTAVTLPIMLFLGINPLVANGTNRLPVFLGFLTSVFNFAKAEKIPWKPSIILSIPIASGTAIGALFVGKLPPIYSEFFVICALVISLTLVIINPKRFLIIEHIKNQPIRLQTIIISFIIGIWAGIIVLDSAIFVLFLLVISLKYELLQANAIKSFLILVIGFVSLCIFLYNGRIDWPAGIILSVGSIIGSYVGSRFSMQESSRIWVFRIIKFILVLELVSLLLKYLKSV